jgi:DHA1 family bicyclomycin/chloramphenicol resistance-like MFS transporter
MTGSSAGQGPGQREFVTLVALLTSLIALSIDAMLPALPELGADLGVRNPNDNQLVVATLFLGLALGQILYGPLSDSFGRKPPMYLGLLIFILGCLLSMFATNYPIMLIGRFLQGFGAAGPRIVSIAMVRDQYQGRAMARIMSFVTAVFIMVPVLSPALGQLILAVADWRAIFGSFLLVAGVSAVWFGLRQPETLPPESRRPYDLGRITRAVTEVCVNRVSFGYTVATGLVFGAFIGYLNSAQQILQQTYGLGVQFPLYFGVLALAIGGASVANAHLVLRLGMRKLSHASMASITLISVPFFLAASAFNGIPPLWAVMAYLMAVFFFFGILFGNLSARAMEPLGHIAGIGASVIGSLSTLISVLLGTVIGRAYDGTVLPLVAGFGLLGLAALLAVLWADKGAAEAG